MEFDLELPKIIEYIKKHKCKLVLIQMPDGIKPLATQVAEELERECKCQVLIYGGSCYGACDLPRLNGIKVDLIVHFGHAKMGRKSILGIDEAGNER
ncbi:MAG: diphthamide synthesis protein [Candidatus Nanoarchaeia archaeon]|nr:diphthamide synthesis protein [Candidatus Haiyanarchaeum thermophilum]MCW1303436.1 diphthamide synthesis protein [Candidatus Haiyanarchaeum thermophilum]MCW1303878.1 diphthamide synthesis protein [Candidatus Haiyanarchaeum thermophilum]MCW1306863.1 diphthamide synthesis protein [Candidatus Haiyanarchaeum thermophilum]MCW1307582.1 diphthamide synthesis protein [Candidatus Haiyanarchaeum thermophilum]